MTMNVKDHKKSCDLTSCISTETDSTEERDDEMFVLKTNPLKHKTEMCKNFSELGRCPYGNRCRFAHGAHELINSKSKKSYRKRNCNGFWKNGFCSYGIRCQFGHSEQEWKTPATLMGMSSIMNEGSPVRCSKLLWLLGN